MFAIGDSEPLRFGDLFLVRHSVVWLGRVDDDGGLRATHPLSEVVLRILSANEYRGSWAFWGETSSFQGFARKAALWRLMNAGWTIDTSDEEIRARRSLSPASPWPYETGPALPWPQREVVTLGTSLPKEVLRLAANFAPAERAVAGERLVLTRPFVEWLLMEKAHALCFGRTHVDNSIGFSVVGPPNRLHPAEHMDRGSIHALHQDCDAAAAWGYARLD